MKRIDAGGLFALIIESSRTVESCFSFNFSQIYKTNSLLRITQWKSSILIRLLIQLEEKELSTEP